MHINSNDLNNFQNEEMNTDEIIAFLEHMNHCDYCLNQLVDEYTDQEAVRNKYLPLELNGVRQLLGNQGICVL